MKKTKKPPVKKKAPDKIEELVKGHLANVAASENTFKDASALLEKYKAKYPELEKYVKNVSPSDRSIEMLDDVKDPKRAHSTFKIALTGVATTYQVTHPEDTDHSDLDPATWISNLEEVLAKAIAQIILGRQSKPSSK